jgi:hypothetical protein
MKKILSIIVISLITINLGFSQLSKAKKFAKSITDKDLKEHLYTYASDEFEGRDTGEEGQKKAVEYLKNYYKSIGIEPGDPDKDYFQPMTLTLRGRRGREGKKVDTENVIAIIKGTEKADEYVVISAHLDHVGVNESGEIYNGADDDGSGTVAMLEIAEAFKKAVKKGKGPKRSIIFLHVTGEEKGLLGSRYYTDTDPIYPLENTVVNLNIDMIGRIDPTREAKNRDYIYLIGSDHDSKDLHNLSEKTNKETINMTLDYRFNDKNDPNRFYYRSDHYNFAKKGIPIIFYFTGTHADYHKPTDTPDKIEYDLLELRTQLIFYTAWNIANRDARLVVDPKPEKVSDSYSHSKKELKSFEGLYKSDAFPRMFHFYENDGKLSMFPEGRSKDESMVLDEKGKNKFKMEMAGLEIEFKEGNKMIFKIGGNEILFNLIPPPTEKLGIEKPEQYKEQE